MKKLLIALLCSVSVASAGLFDNMCRIEQVDPTSTYTFYNWIGPLPSGKDGLVVWDHTLNGGIGSLTGAQFSSDFTLSGGVVSLTNGPSTPTFQNTPSRGIQTVAAAANGFQVSSTKVADVSYSMRFSTTATIGGASNCEAVLEICATNSATATDWIEIDRCGNGQTISLAVTLQSVQTTVGKVSGKVPAGWYARVRRAIQTGTSSVTAVSGQEYIP